MFSFEPIPDTTSYHKAFPSITVQELVKKDQNLKLRHSGREVLSNCGGSSHRMSPLLDFQGDWWKTGPKEVL